MKKFFISVLVVGLVLVMIGVSVISLWGGTIIKKSVNSFAPSLLGVPVVLQDASFSLLQGRVCLFGLHISNPKGFKTEALLEVNRIEVEVALGSLFADTIVIRRILVQDPQFTYEQGLLKSNLGALLDQLGGDKAATPTSGGGDAKQGRKVVIDELTLTGGKIKLSVTAAMGFSAPISMATMSLKNIGREGGTEGLGVTDVVRIIIGTVLKSAVGAVGGLGGLAIDGVKAIGGGARKIGEGTMDAMKSMGGGKVADGAKEMGQGAIQVGGAAVEGVKQIGTKVGDVMGGIFGSSGETNDSVPVR